MASAPSLSTIPVELLRLVFQFLDRTTLSQLCLSSRNLRAVAEEYLYRNIRLGQERHQSRTSRIRLLIRTLHARPALCRHVKAIYGLTTDASNPVMKDRYSEEYETHSVGIPQDHALVEKLLSEDDYGRREFGDIEWYPDLFHKLLIRMVRPYVEEMWIHMPHLGMPTVKERIASRRCANVSRLVVDLTGFQAGVGAALDCTFLRLFAPEKIRALHVHVTNMVNLASATLPNLTTLEFSVLAVKDERNAAVHFIQSCAQLKHLSVSFQNCRNYDVMTPFPEHRNHIEGVAQFVNSLTSTPCASNITHLRLTAPDSDNMPPVLATSEYNLTPFRSLTILEMDLLLELCAPDRSAQYEPSRPPVILRDILPSSLETLILRRAPCLDMHIEGVLNGLFPFGDLTHSQYHVPREPDLPNLRRVHLSHRCCRAYDNGSLNSDSICKHGFDLLRGKSGFKQTRDYPSLFAHPTVQYSVSSIKWTESNVQRRYPLRTRRSGCSSGEMERDQWYGEAGIMPRDWELKDRVWERWMWHGDYENEVEGTAIRRQDGLDVSNVPEFGVLTHEERELQCFFGRDGGHSG